MHLCSRPSLSSLKLFDVVTLLQMQHQQQRRRQRQIKTVAQQIFERIGHIPKDDWYPAHCDEKTITRTKAQQTMLSANNDELLQIDNWVPGMLGPVMDACKNCAARSEVSHVTLERSYRGAFKFGKYALYPSVDSQISYEMQDMQKIKATQNRMQPGGEETLLAKTEIPMTTVAEFALVLVEL